MGLDTRPAANSRADRLASFALADFPPPTGREEEWRFTPLAPLARLLDGPGSGPVNLSADDVAGPVEIVTVPPGDGRLGRVGAPSDRLAALAWDGFGAADVVVVRGPDARAVVRWEPGDAEPAAGHLVIRAEPNSRGVIIVWQTGPATISQGVEIELDQGADLTIVTIYDGSPGAIGAASHRIALAADAHLSHTVVALGGAVVRQTTDLRFDGPGGAADLLGLNLTGAGQHHENRLFIDHAAPRCRSRVTYKGALTQAGARSVWVGDVLIRAGADGTDTYELNRNLVLARGARADSVPNLEIETGQIERAGHASATGRFDEEQMFYLRSRGIDELSARRLVVHAFFAELVAQIGLPDLQSDLIARIDSRLAAIDAGPAANQPGRDGD